MSMAGQPVSAEDEETLRQIFRGELSGDEAALKLLEDEGLGETARAQELRRRIAASA